MEKLRADITSSLVMPVTQPEMTSLAPLFDLFAFEEPIGTFLRKIPCTDENMEERNVRAKLSKDDKKDLELTLRASMHKEEIRLARERDRVRGIGPSKKSTIVEETTLQGKGS